MLSVLYRLLTVTVFGLGLGVVGCGGTPCTDAVDKQIRFSAAEGSKVEKDMAAEAGTKAGAREGLIAVCSKMAAKDKAFAARIECQASASNLASFKTCVTATP